MREGGDDQRAGPPVFLGLRALLARLEVPADAVSWKRLSGALLLVLLCLLFLSGAVLALYYTPAPGSAYDSVDFVQFGIPFGGLIRGVHHYAWNLLLIVLGLHLLRGFILGAYKAPRQGVWVSGVLFVVLIPLCIITGDLLPWDQKGYWSTQVRLGIFGSVPWIGDFLVKMLRGGPLTGIVALTRFYVLHVLLLPSALLSLVVVHAYLVVSRGLSASVGDGAVTRSKRPFFPDLVHRWLVLFLVASVILGVASWLRPAPLGDPADPADSTYVPRPEWWVLFLNQMVTLFKGRLAVVGSTLVPLGLVGLLLALPYVDRGPERHPGRRLAVMIGAAIVAAVLVGASIAGYLEHYVVARPAP